ncbi:hypothetical protein PanWU01x14_325740 [Parasponia andersonii]|uniref:Uncharacterized protein n=1 Tax=Parasponia andersonii TaxID=3476 RepID=A0A2P5AJN7_PARAD|nr:hypothetical protein PanWU01x14_325740 [Parasponia andersonii]
MRINSSSLKSLRNGDVAIVGGRVLVLAAASPHRDVPHGATSSPVSLTSFTEMARLVDIVIVVVAEFGVHTITTRTWQNLIRLLQGFLLGVIIGCIALFLVCLRDFRHGTFFAYGGCLWVDTRRLW